MSETNGYLLFCAEGRVPLAAWRADERVPAILSTV